MLFQETDFASFFNRLSRDGQGVIVLRRLTIEQFLDNYVSFKGNIPIRDLKNGNVLGDLDKVKGILDTWSSNIVFHQFHGKTYDELDHLLIELCQAKHSFVFIDSMDELKGNPGLQICLNQQTDEDFPEMWGGEWAHDQNGGILPAERDYIKQSRKGLHYE